MSTPTNSTNLPERSLNRQIVLEEDDYTAALSHIIARDFFPSLLHLDATNEYLDALHSRDPHLINASVRRLEEISSTPIGATSRHGLYQTPSQTPYAFGPSQTPSQTPREGQPNKRQKFDTNVSLDDFQARFTSEDNSSFTQILDDENRKRKEKYGWAWEAQNRVETQRNKMIEGRERMLIEAPQVAGVREKFAIDLPKPAGLLTDGSEGRVEKDTDGESEKSNDLSGGKELVKIAKDAEEAVDFMAPLKDNRSAGVDAWAFKARNSLMFSPDADASPYDPSSSTFKPPDPRVIKYGNTRLTEQNHSTAISRANSAPPSPTRSRIEAAITGTPYRPRSPSQNDFSLVPTLPSPTPAELGPAAVKQLMTWGTLNATPRIISRTDDSADLPPSITPFHIPDISSREVISHKLSANASKSLRAKANLLGLGGRTPGILQISTPGKKGNMGPPSWTPRRTEGNLTPAAKRLLARTTVGTASSRRAEANEQRAGWDGKGKEGERYLDSVRWTPTPTSVSRK